jgi:hypothetical protein
LFAGIQAAGDGVGCQRLGHAPTST